MGVFDLLELSLSYIQYLVLILSSEPSPFPDFYTSPLLVLNALNLDVSEAIDKFRDPLNSAEIRAAIPASIPLDIRFQFLLIGILAPMFYSTISLLFLAPKSFIVWFLMMLFATFLIVSGTLFSLLPEPLVDVEHADSFFAGVLIAGIVCLVLGMLYGAYWLVTTGIRERKSDGACILQTQEPISKSTTVAQILSQETSEVDTTGQILRSLYFSVCVVLGLACLQVYEISFLPFFGKLGYASTALGVALFVFAGGSFTLFVASLVKEGRERLWKLANSAQNILLSLSLLVVTGLYVPVGSSVVRILNTAVSVCPANYRLPDSSDSLVEYYSYASARASNVNNYATSSNFSAANANVVVPSYCQPIDTLAGNLYAAATACPSDAFSSTTGRIFADRSVKATTDLKAYLVPAAVIMLVTFIGGLALLQYLLTRAATHAIEKEYPLDARQSIGLDFEGLMEEKLTLSDNVARIIYAPFRREFRYWRMLALLHRFFLILSATLHFEVTEMDNGISSTSLSLCLSFGFNCLMSILFIALRPYARRIENYFAITTQSLITVVNILGLASSTNGNSLAPTWLYIVVAVSLFLLPLVALTAGGLWTKYDFEEKSKVRARRIQHAIEKAVEVNVYQEQPEFEITGVTEDAVIDEEIGRPLSRRISRIFREGFGTTNNNKSNNSTTNRSSGNGSSNTNKKNNKSKQAANQNINGGTVSANPLAFDLGLDTQTFNARGDSPHSSTTSDDDDDDDDDDIGHRRVEARQKKRTSLFDRHKLVPANPRRSNNNINNSTTNSSMNERNTRQQQQLQQRDPRSPLSRTDQETNKMKNSIFGTYVVKASASHSASPTSDNPRREGSFFRQLNKGKNPTTSVGATATTTAVTTSLAKDPEQQGRKERQSAGDFLVGAANKVGVVVVREGGDVDIGGDGGGDDHLPEDFSVAAFSNPRDELQAIVQTQESQGHFEMFDGEEESENKENKLSHQQQEQPLPRSTSPSQQHLSIFDRSSSPLELVTGARRALWRKRSETAGRMIKYRVGDIVEQVHSLSSMSKLTSPVGVKSESPSPAATDHHRSADVGGGSAFNISFSLSDKGDDDEDDEEGDYYGEVVVAESVEVRTRRLERERKTKLRNIWFWAINQMIDDLIVASIDSYLDERKKELQAQLKAKRQEGENAQMNFELEQSSVSQPATNIQLAGSTELPTGQNSESNEEPHPINLRQTEKSPSPADPLEIPCQNDNYNATKIEQNELPLPLPLPPPPPPPPPPLSVFPCKKVPPPPLVSPRTRTTTNATTTTTTKAVVPNPSLGSNFGSHSTCNQNTSNNSTSFAAGAAIDLAVRESALHHEQFQQSALGSSEEEIVFRPLESHPSIVLKRKVPKQYAQQTGHQQESEGGDTRRYSLAAKAVVQRQEQGWRKALVGIIANQHDLNSKSKLPPSLQGKHTRELLALQEALSQPIRSEADEQKVRARVKLVYEQHLRGVSDRQEATDYRVNRETNMTLQIFFTIVGLASFIALGLTSLGVNVSQQQDRRTFLPPNGLDSASATFQYKFLGKPVNGVDLSLAGYGNWTAFVQNCCCAAFQNQTYSDAVTVEKWLCPGGVVKERLRKTKTVDSLVTVRPLCGRSFVNGCSVDVTATSPFFVSLIGCNSTVVSAEEQKLW